MDSFPENVVDVTKVLAEALPDFLANWSGARLYLVPGHPSVMSGARIHPTRGGLPAGTLRKIRAFIEGELANSITLHDLALIAELSDCHFARAFKQSMGMPPHRYLTHRRIERAIESILETDRPLAQIALEAGFCDQSHFSRSIARATGKTPRDIRRASFGPAVAVRFPDVVARNAQDYSPATFPSSVGGGGS
jgi:AraC-like DNA-binding protein